MEKLKSIFESDQPLVRSSRWIAAATLMLASVATLASGQTVNEQYSLAAGHYERQEFDSAIEQFRSIIETYPSTRRAAVSYFYLGESLIQKGDYHAAFPAYEIFLARLPQDDFAARAQFRLAECAYRMKLDQKAVTLLEKYVTSHGDSELASYAYTYLGELRLKRSEPQLSLRVFQHALAQYPNSQGAGQNRYGLARSLQALGQTDQAAKQYAILADSGSGEFFGKAQMQLGVMHLQGGQIDVAKDRLQKSLLHITDLQTRTEAKYWLAKAEMAGGDFDSAFVYLQEAIETTEQDDLKVKMLFDGAISAAQTGKNQIAVNWLDQLRKTWPDTAWSEDSLQMSIELNYKADNYKQAMIDIHRFETEFHDHAQLPVIREYKGRIEYDWKQYDQAASTFGWLIDNYASSADQSQRLGTWLYLRGLAEIGLKQFAKASETLSQVETEGKDQGFKTSVLLAKASSAVGLGQDKTAITFFQQYLAAQPTGASADRARSDLAIAYAQIGDWKSCEELLNQYRSAHEDQNSYLETNLLVGELALTAKRFALADRCFKLLTDQRNPRNYVVRGLSGRAWVQMAQGEEKSAVAVFEQIVSEFGESDYAAEAAMASGKYFEQNDRHDDAIAMYWHVIEKFASTKFVPLAKLRLSYNLVKTQTADQKAVAEGILNKYLASQSELLDEALYQLAWIYQDTQRPKKSLQMFERIVDDFQDSVYWPDAVYRVAQQKIIDQDYQRVAELLQQIRTTDVTRSLRNRLDFLEGQLAAQQQKWDVAEGIMSRVLADCDDETLRKKSRYWLAESLYQREDYENANQEFCRLLDHPDALTDNRLAWVNLRSAQCYARLENWPKALESATRSKTKFKDFEAAYEFDFVIGRCHAAQGRLIEARKSYRSVVQSPLGKSTLTAAMAQWRIGETFFHQEDYERAIEAYYRVDSLYAYEKWRAAALVEAGKCQEHLGNWNHAVKLYHQLVKNFPDSNFRVIAEKRLNMATRQAKNIKAETHK